MKKIDEPSLHVSYIPRLLTKKKRKVISQYFHRFYTPFSIVIWSLVAFDVDDCKHMVYVVPLLTFISSIYCTRKKYNEYYKDLVYILERSDFEMDQFMKLHYLIFEFVIQYMASYTSLYWINEVHSCLRIDRIHQSYLFVVIMAVTFFLHVIHYLQTKKQTEFFVRQTYSHLSTNEV